jgi:hypothetical protein
MTVSCRAGAASRANATNGTSASRRHGLDAEAVDRGRGRHRDDGRLREAFAHGAARLRRGLLVQGDGRRRMMMREACEGALHDRHPGDGLEPDREPCPVVGRCDPSRIDRTLRGRERDARLIQERAACGREVHAARGARHELAADLSFQRADLAAERRLGHVQPFGRPPEVLLLRERDEVS